MVATTAATAATATSRGAVAPGAWSCLWGRCYCCCCCRFVALALVDGVLAREQTARVRAALTTPTSSLEIRPCQTASHALEVGWYWIGLASASGTGFHSEVGKVCGRGGAATSTVSTVLHPLAVRVLVVVVRQTNSPSTRYATTTTDDSHFY